MPGLFAISQIAGNRWRPPIAKAGSRDAVGLAGGCATPGRDLMPKLIRKKPGLISAAYRILTARAARSTITANEIVAWSIIKSFAQRARTGASVGDKAVLVLKATNR